MSNEAQIADRRAAGPADKGTAGLNSTAAAQVSPRAQAAIEGLRFDALQEMADLAASVWRSISEAAYRRDLAVVNVHCRQAAAVTRAAFALAKTLAKKDNAA